MKAEERNIGGVLTEQIRYEIPPYQRPYSWEAEHVNDLLSDIAEAFEAKDREYFIGSLITIELEPNARYEVVDGQQRLTTLNLIFARLKEAIQSPEAKQAIGSRILPRNPLTGQVETPRLTLRQKDHGFFRDHVLNGKPIADVVAGNLEGAKARIAQNIAATDAFLGSRTQDWLMKYANYILQNVFVVTVKTENFQSAYRLFNVLNDRGLGLSNADLIKNKLFQRLEEADEIERREELEELWVKLEETTGLENLDTFLGYHRTAKRADKARSSLADQYDELIGSYSGSPLDFLRELIESAANYDKILEGDFAESQAKRALAALRRVTYDEWVPALLAFLNKPVVGMAESEFVTLLERITMQNWVRRLGRTARNTIYYRLIAAIERFDNAQSVRKVFRDSSNNDEFFTLLNGDVYGYPSARAVLLRLEEGGQDDQVTRIYGSSITIEHVLPQSLKDAYWSSRFSPSEHQEWVHRLGNLTPLSGTKNSSAQNSSFSIKKQIYLKRNAKVSFDLTKEVCQESEWTVKQIRERQERLMELAKHLWTIA